MLLLGSVDHCLLRHDDAAAAAVLSYQQSQVKQTYAPPTGQECSDKEKSGCTTTSSREFMNEERLQVPYTINNATSSRLDLIARGGGCNQTPTATARVTRHRYKRFLSL